MTDGQMGSVRVTHGDRWPTALASLTVGVAFFSLGSGYAAGSCTPVGSNNCVSSPFFYSRSPLQHRSSHLSNLSRFTLILNWY
jgi:hypothetical protein